MADDETSARRKAWAKATGMVNQAPPDSTPDTPVPSDPAGSLDVIVRDPDTGELGAYRLPESVAVQGIAAGNVTAADQSEESRRAFEELAAKQREEFQWEATEASNGFDMLLGGFTMGLHRLDEESRRGAEKYRKQNPYSAMALETAGFVLPMLLTWGGSGAFQATAGTVKGAQTFAAAGRALLGATSRSTVGKALSLGGGGLSQRATMAAAERLGIEGGIKYGVLEGVTSAPQAALLATMQSEDPRFEEFGYNLAAQGALGMLIPVGLGAGAAAAGRAWPGVKKFLKRNKGNPAVDGLEGVDASVPQDVATAYDVRELVGEALADGRLDEIPGFLQRAGLIGGNKALNAAKEILQAGGEAAGPLKGGKARMDLVRDVSRAIEDILQGAQQARFGQGIREVDGQLQVDPAGIVALAQKKDTLLNSSLEAFALDPRFEGSAGRGFYSNIATASIDQMSGLAATLAATVNKGDSAAGDGLKLLEALFGKAQVRKARRITTTRGPQGREQVTENFSTPDPARLQAVVREHLERVASNQQVAVTKAGSQGPIRELKLGRGAGKWTKESATEHRISFPDGEAPITFTRSATKNKAGKYTWTAADPEGRTPFTLKGGADFRSMRPRASARAQEKGWLTRGRQTTEQAPDFRVDGEASKMVERIRRASEAPAEYGWRGNPGNAFAAVGEASKWADSIPLGKTGKTSALANLKVPAANAFRDLEKNAALWGDEFVGVQAQTKDAYSRLIAAVEKPTGKGGFAGAVKMKAGKWEADSGSIQQQVEKAMFGVRGQQAPRMTELMHWLGEVTTAGQNLAQLRQGIAESADLEGAMAKSFDSGIRGLAQRMEQLRLVQHANEISFGLIDAPGGKEASASLFFPMMRVVGRAVGSTVPWRVRYAVSGLGTEVLRKLGTSGTAQLAWEATSLPRISRGIARQVDWLRKRLLSSVEVGNEALNKGSAITVAEARKKVPPPPVVAGIAVPSGLRLADEWGPSEPTVEERFEEMRSSLEQLGPDALIAATGTLTAPYMSVDGTGEMSAVVAQRMTAQWAYVMDQMPTGEPDPLTGRTYPVSNAEARGFLHMLDALGDPTGVIGEYVATGLVRPEGLQAIQENHPEIFAQMALGIMQHATQMKAVSYPNRLTLSEVFGVDADATVEPGFVAAMNAEYSYSHTAEQASVAGQAAAGAAYAVAARALPPSSRSIADKEKSLAQGFLT